jgi:hypothetical protein
MKEADGAVADVFIFGERHVAAREKSDTGSKLKTGRTPEALKTLASCWNRVPRHHLGKTHDRDLRGIKLESWDWSVIVWAMPRPVNVSRMKAEMPVALNACAHPSTFTLTPPDPWIRTTAGMRACSRRQFRTPAGRSAIFCAQ